MKKSLLRQNEQARTDEIDSGVQASKNTAKYSHVKILITFCFVKAFKCAFRLLDCFRQMILFVF